MLPVIISIPKFYAQWHSPYKFTMYCQEKFILKYEMQVSWLPTPMAID
jgi:hypothetical protein